MSTVTLTKQTARPATCTLPWCTGNHAETRSFRDHGSPSIRENGLHVRVSWSEPLDALARYSDIGIRVYFATQGIGSLLLSPKQAADLAEVMEELDQDRAAGLLRKALALIEDGAK